MKVLCCAVKRMNEIFPFMKEHAKLFGKNTEIFGEEFDDPSYKVLTEYFATVEKNGPEGQKTPEFLGKYGDAEILLTFYSPFGKKAFDLLKSMRMIGSIRGGYQHINVEEATRRGVAVFSVPGRNAESVSDYAIAMLLAEARELCRNANIIMSGKWVDPSFKNHYQPDLSQKTVGVVGFGAIGRLVAQKLGRGWNMRVLAYDPFVSKEDAKAAGVELVDLETIFAESDFVTLHAKVTDSNKGMISRKLLESMKPTAFLVNTARAALVDTQALYDVLKAKKIAGAALDVMDKEPIDADDPFLSLDNVTITGHLAGNSSDTTQNSPRLLVNEMLDVIYGRSTRGLVNPQVLEDEGFKAWLEKIKAELAK